MIIYSGGDYKGIKRTQKKTLRVGKSMQGGNKLRRGDLPSGEGAGAIVPIGWQKGTYIVALGRSWSTVTGQKIPSQVQAGGCWWVGTQKEWSAGSRLPASGVCIRGPTVRWSQKWSQSRAYQGNVCIIGCPAGRG